MTNCEMLRGENQQNVDSGSGEGTEVSDLDHQTLSWGWDIRGEPPQEFWAEGKTNGLQAQKKRSGHQMQLFLEKRQQLESGEQRCRAGRGPDRPKDMDSEGLARPDEE